MNLSLWVKDYDCNLSFDLCFIADIPVCSFPLIDGDNVFEDEMDLSPMWLDIDDFGEQVDGDFKQWYEKSGFGYIYLAPSFFDLMPYKVDGCVGLYTINGSKAGAKE